MASHGSVHSSGEVSASSASSIPGPSAPPLGGADNNDVVSFSLRRAVSTVVVCMLLRDVFVHFVLLLIFVK